MREGGLKIDAIEFGRGEFRLGPVSLCLAPGEVLGVLGPNGCGKSTLLALCSGLLRPLRGSISSPPPGVLFQRHETHRRLPVTVEEVVSFGRLAAQRPRRPEQDRRAVKEALGHLRLEGLRGRLYRTLSGGEQQRTQLARLAAQGSPLWLLDEPAGGLDAAAREELTRLVEELCEDLALTVVIVTHDPSQLPGNLTKVLLLSQGRVHALGRPGKVLTRRNISRLYGRPLEVSRTADRWHFHPSRGRR